MTTTRIIVGVLALLATIWHALAILRAESRLQALRRSEASPVPTYNWVRFRYFGDPANLQPGAEALVFRYERLWYGFLWIPLAWIVLIPWMLR